MTETEPTTSRRRRLVAVVTLTYVAVTVGESLLAPVLPIVAPDLGIEVAGMGRTLGALSMSIGVANLIGGALLARTNARVTSVLGAAFSAVGCLAAMFAQSEAVFVGTQVLIGLGAGLFFAGGVFSVNALTPPSHTGRALARYGIAYSAALGLAAGLVVGLGAINWRLVFAVSTVLAIVSGILAMTVELPGAKPIDRGEWRRALGLLGAPVLVGGVAAIAQFGLVVFIPAFGVEHWALSATAAAGVLFVGRIVSIPGKYVAGWMVDRLGVGRAARVTGLALFASGLAWVVLPDWAAIVAAVFFATAAGALFPMANVVAVQQFGDLGSLLGVFRFVQMVIAAVSVSLIGAAASWFGMQAALGWSMVALLAILGLTPRVVSAEESIRSRS